MIKLSTPQTQVWESSEISCPGGIIAQTYELQHNHNKQPDLIQVIASPLV